MKKRILSFFLALVMLFSCMSLNIFATEETPEAKSAGETVVANTFADHNNSQIKSFIKALSKVSKYSFGNGNTISNDGVNAYIKDGRIVVGPDIAGKSDSDGQFFNQIADHSDTSGRGSIANFATTHTRGNKFIAQLDLEITENLFYGTAYTMNLIQLSSYLNNQGRDNGNIYQTGAWMPNVIQLAVSNDTDKTATLVGMRQGTQGAEVITNLEVGHNYTIAVHVDTSVVDAANGIYGIYDVYIDGEQVKNDIPLASKGNNDLMVFNPAKPYFTNDNAVQKQADGTWKLVLADQTAYFFVEPGTLDGTKDENNDGILDIYQYKTTDAGGNEVWTSWAGITKDLAPSKFVEVGVADGIDDFMLGFVRFVQHYNSTCKNYKGDAFSFDNMIVYFADEYIDVTEHSIVAGDHDHDYTASASNVTYVCEYCNGYKTVTTDIDVNNDRVCDICVGELEVGGILSIDELNGMLSSDDIRYTNDFGTGGSHGFHTWYNDGKGLTIPAENGNGYLLYGPTTGDAIKLYGQFNVSKSGEYNSLRAWPLNNFDTYKGKSYVVSTDIMRFEGCEAGTGNLFHLMNYAKLNANGDGFDFAGAFSPISIDKNGTIYYNDANGASYNSGFTLEAGRYYNVAVHHTPKTNSYDILVDGVKINEKSISALGSSMNSALTFDASEKLGIVSNGAVDFIPSAVQVAQISTKLTQNAWALDNIKFYYSEDFIECDHDYKLSHEHDIANKENTVSYVCTRCGLSKTVELAMSSVETATPAHTIVIDNDFTAFGTGALTVGRHTKNGVVICNQQGGISIINEGGKSYAKIGNKTVAEPTDSDYIQAMSVANWNDVQNLINNGSELIGAPYLASVDFIHYGVQKVFPFGQVSSYINKSSDSKTVSFSPVYVTHDGFLGYQNAGVDVPTNVKINEGKSYNIAFLHTPATNSFDVYVNGALVVKGATALNAANITSCTWTNSNGKAISEKSFIPGFVRASTISGNSKGDIYAMSSYKLVNTSVNIDCAHSFKTDKCEWCGVNNTNYAHCEICDGTAISANAAVVSKSASLGEMIDMNVYMALSEKLVKTEGAKVTLNCGNRSAEYALADAVKEANGLYKFSIELRSTQMASDVEVKVVGETSDTYKTSIKAYAEELIEANVSEKATALAKAMLNYGATAQKYFAIKNDDAALDDVLANAGLSADDQKVDAEIMNKAGLNALTYAPNDSDPLDGVQFTAATIMFSAKTHVKVYFTASENATVTVGGRQVTPIASENEGEYYVTFTVENPAEAMTRVSIVVNDGAASVGQDFSAGLLVKVGVDANANAELTALLLAYANYAYCASNYAI